MKKHLTVIIIAVVIAIIAMGFSGCQSASAPAGEAAAEEGQQEKYTVGYQIYFEGNDWSLQMAEEFKYAIENEYMDMVEEIHYVSDQFDITKQMNNFDDLVTKGCDIIFLSPLDPNAMVEKIKQAEEDGIKVVVFAIDMNGEDFTSSVNVSDYEHGKVMGEWIGDLGVEGKVAVMNGIAGTQTAIDVHDGIVDAAENYPGIELLEDIYTDWDFAVTKQATQDTLQANPDLAGIITHSDPRACAEVFLESGKPLIPITWMGSNGCLRVWKENFEQFPEGTAAFTKPPYVSAIALEVGMKALQGEEVEKFVQVPIHIIEEDELDEFYNPELSDRFWAPSRLSIEATKELFPKE